MSDCHFGVSPVNYPDPDPYEKKADSAKITNYSSLCCLFIVLVDRFRFSQPLSRLKSLITMLPEECFLRSKYHVVNGKNRIIHCDV